MTGRIGITLGDVTGIGPEVTLKTLAQWPAPTFRCLIIGDATRLKSLNDRLRLGVKLEAFESWDKPGQFFVLDGAMLPNDLPVGSPLAAEAALEYLEEGITRSLSGELDGIVTAPVNKETILRLGEPFVGQTEWISQRASANRTAMMLLGSDDRGRWLRVALATTHLPIKDVACSLNTKKIQTVIELASEACAQLGLPRRRIGVCGLNPHAGEGGELGTEELSIIAPAIRAARENKIEAIGPLAADTLFHHAFRGEYDAVVAMYHDQGLAPLKMVAFETGVNWTLGLPFVRTSPDHGTAYDLAGRGQASPSSMISAVRLACQIAAHSAQR
jgi:4-phospho-D-threonate 3-dehydrogenase / 4-phospho-D-erythronate 3-dehydrogenase